MHMLLYWVLKSTVLRNPQHHLFFLRNPQPFRGKISFQGYKTHAGPSPAGVINVEDRYPADPSG